MASEKLKECLVYFVLKHSGKIQRTKLVKLVYLSDLLSYQKRGETITGISYISYDHGPWSQSFYEGFEETPEITERIGVTSLGDICYTYCGAVPKYEYKYLATADIQLLQEIDEKWGNRSLKDVLAYAYDTKPFKASKFGEGIDFTHQL